MSEYGKHVKERPQRGEGPDVDAIVLAKSKGFFVQRTYLGTRKSFALLKDGMVILRDCRMWEVRDYLEKVEKTR